MKSARRKACPCGDGLFLLYRKYRATLKHESYVSYRAKSPTGQDAQLAEKKFMLRIPLARESVRQAHTLFFGAAC